MVQKIYRQGDVGIIPLDSPPNMDVMNKAKHVLKDEKRKLIRRGENGGVHELESLDTATIFSDVSTDENVKALFGRYIEVREPTQIVHGEHAPILLQPGWYEIAIQRESFDGAVRTVRD